MDKVLPMQGIGRSFCNIYSDCKYKFRSLVDPICNFLAGFTAQIVIILREVELRLYSRARVAITGSDSLVRTGLDIVGRSWLVGVLRHGKPPIEAARL